MARYYSNVSYLDALGKHGVVLLGNVFQVLLSLAILPALARRHRPGNLILQRRGRRGFGKRRHDSRRLFLFVSRQGNVLLAAALAALLPVVAAAAAAAVPVVVYCTEISLVRSYMVNATPHRLTVRTMFEACGPLAFGCSRSAVLERPQRSFQI